MYPKNLPISTAPSNRRSNPPTRSYASALRGGFLSLIIIFFVSAAFFQACQDNNIVGSSFIEGDRDVIVDTLSIEGFENVDLKTFTGNLPFFSAGQYSDQLYGDINSSAFLAPGLIPTSRDSILLDAEMYLIFKPQTLYGDTTSTVSFDVFFINQRWRPNATTVDTEVSFDPVPFASFTVDSETDSVAVPLPQDWVNRYRDDFFYADPANRDDILLNTEFGFRIAPSDGDALVGFRGTAQAQDSVGRQTFIGTRMLVVNPPEFQPELLDEDEPEPSYSELVSLPFRGWGYNVMRENIPELPDGSIPVFNNFSTTIKFDLDLGNETIKKQNISRVELVLYEDTTAVSQTLPENHNRPSSGRLLLYRLQPWDTDFLVTQLPNFEPLRNSSDRSYRINLTETVRAIQLGSTFSGSLYLLSGPNNGLFYPNSLTTSAAGTQRSPKLIITRINPEDN